MADKSAVRNNVSSADIDSYDQYSLGGDEHDDDLSARRPVSQPSYQNFNYPKTIAEANIEYINNLPPSLSERLKRIGFAETFNDDHINLHYATADFEDASDNSECLEGEGETSESGASASSSSSYIGPASASTEISGGSPVIMPYRSRAPDDSNDECDDTDECDGDGQFLRDDEDFGRLSNIDEFASENADSSKSKKSSSNAVISSLKKRWRGMRKAGARGTSSAGKYFGRETETWEDRHSRIGDEWINCIIPAWSKKRRTRRVRTLVFKGIPVNVRGRVWQCAIGNPLNISKELFDVLKDRAEKGRAAYQRGKNDVPCSVDMGDIGEASEYIMNMEESERSAHKAISLDLPRTFPELTFFHAEGSHYEHALRDVLEAFLYLKPDLGYSQGMSFVAAVLLLYMDPYESFCCFSNMLLYKSCFLNFFRIKMPEVKCYLLVHDKFVEEEMPTLFTHFKTHGIDSDLYMINWVMSLYCRALRLDLVTRIWDLYVLDGDIAIFRSALGILRLFMNQLLAMKFEEMAYFLSHIPSEQINADELLQSIRSVRIVTRKKFIDLFRQFRAQHD